MYFSHFLAPGLVYFSHFFGGFYSKWLDFGGFYSKWLDLVVFTQNGWFFGCTGTFWLYRHLLAVPAPHGCTGTPPWQQWMDNRPLMSAYTTAGRGRSGDAPLARQAPPVSPPQGVPVSADVLGLECGLVVNGSQTGTDRHQRMSENRKKKSTFLAVGLRPPARDFWPGSGFLTKWPILADFADFASFQGKTVGVFARKSLNLAKIPRHSGVFLTHFGWTLDARSGPPFSVHAKSPHIQGSRKVENAICIFIHPIWTRVQNWCYRSRF